MIQGREEKEKNKEGERTKKRQAQKIWKAQETQGRGSSVSKRKPCMKVLHNCQCMNCWEKITQAVHKMVNITFSFPKTAFC